MSSGFARHIRRQVSRSSHDATSSAAEIDCGSAWNGLGLGAFAGSALAIANGIQGEVTCGTNARTAFSFQIIQCFIQPYWIFSPLQL
jgi:hypothetical protein